jgi:hypothetical protein
LTSDKLAKGYGWGMAVGSWLCLGYRTANGFFQSILYHMLLDSRKLEMHDQAHKALFKGVLDMRGTLSSQVSG